MGAFGEMPCDGLGLCDEQLDEELDAAEGHAKGVLGDGPKNEDNANSLSVPAS